MRFFWSWDQALSTATTLHASRRVLVPKSLKGLLVHTVSGQPSNADLNSSRLPIRANGIP
jgi:hypothetical protein